MLLIVQAVFVLLALAVVVATFYPVPGWPWARRPMPWAVLWLLLELLILALVYWVILALFLGQPTPLGRL